MWLSNAPGVCSLACWAPGSDETPIGFNIGAGASIGGVRLTQYYCFPIKEY